RERIVAALGRTARVCRGPKPAAALKAMGLDPGITVPEPNTWVELLKTIDEKAPVGGRRVAVQEYGISNLELLRGLQERGARVSLRNHGLQVDLEPPHPKMGPLVKEASLRCQEILEGKRAGAKGGNGGGRGTPSPKGGARGGAPEGPGRPARSASMTTSAAAAAIAIAPAPERPAPRAADALLDSP